MATYSIFVRPDDAEPLAVADRFSWFAALLPPVYALVHGLWLGLAGYFVLVAALIGAALWIGDDATTLLYILFAILVGFEAPTLRRLKLGRRRYAYRGERIAQSAELAEVGWLEGSGPR